VFDFRYHALSLVAVFLALAIGLVLGVAIGDRGLVSSAESDLRASLRRDVVRARDEASDLRRQLSERDRIESRDFYPIMVGDRLAGARVGIVAFGDVPNDYIDDVQSALDGTGGRLTSVSVIREPLDLEALSAAAGQPFGADLTRRPDLVFRLGRKVGVQLRTGGEFLSSVGPALLSRGRSSGSLDGLEGVILVHDRPDPEDAAANRAATAFEDGLVRGLKGRGAQLAGIETSEQQPSAIPWFQRHNLSSVDDIDLIEGRTALVYVLAGEEGTFGVKSTADALLPTVVAR
jgi:hypothetical protein